MTAVMLSALVLTTVGRTEAAPPAPTVVPFALSDGNTMVGYHYEGDPARPLLIMLHGASDTHTVFDFTRGFRSAARLAQRGYTVLTVDRVGYGASSHPNGDGLNFFVSAGYVHEVVQAVRGGALGFSPTKVVLLGPSVGADITMVEAATYHDVDGVVVAFNTSQLQPALFAVDVNAWFAQGPYFDFGVPFRTDFFYAQPYALQWIINQDNATRALVPRAEIGSALSGLSAPSRAQIDVPVLLIQAENDGLFVPVDDSALFSAAPDVAFQLLSNTGHKAFSHPTSHAVVVDVIASWLGSRF